MNLTAKIIMEVAHHEGLVREAYKDSVGIWTWSIGVTNASGHNVERYIGSPQNLERCMEVYVWLLETKYLPAVRRAFKGHDLTEAQIAAALSFHWNTGAIERASWVKRWKAGDVAGAKKAFMDWRKPKEIIPRRQGERDLFFAGKWAGDGTVTEWTRVRSGGQIDWTSGVKRDVSAVLAKIMNPEQPPAPPQRPTQPQPAPKPTPAPSGGIMAFLRAILSIFGGRK